ncbi:MAG: SLC13 family permease, partial [Actinobacteria bacterium]|nr:SLC13 family permease [Actinomycetota bacterium]
MDPVAATFVILGLAVVAFVSGRISLGVVAIGVSLALWVTGVLTLPEALAGFGDPTVLFIASLFVVSEALDASGVTAWVGRFVVARAGRRRIPIILMLSAVVALLAAFISINGAVAALVPVAVVVARRAGLVPSQVLIPVAFTASAASLLTLAGTPVNPVVSELAAASGGRPFGFFEFALVGVPLVVGTVAIVLLLGRRTLPNRVATAMSTDLSVHASTLRSAYDVHIETAEMFTAREGVAEVVVSPRSRFVGATAFAGMTTEPEGLVILGIRRGEQRPDATSTGRVTLEAGDALLLQGPWGALDHLTRGPDVLVSVEPRAVQRTVPLGRGARRTLVITAIMVLLLATGLVPPAVAGLLAAGALVVSRVLTAPQTYRAISWTTVVLIAGMIPLSSAFLQTGAADVVAAGVLNLVGGAAPQFALLVLCVVTIVLGQFISNVATVLIVAPIAASIAGSLDLSVQPFMMALTVAGAASFLTPVATPANLMVLEPGGYRFGDYWRLGA